MNPLVESFFDPATFTFTYVVYDRAGGSAVVIDPVLDYDAASARTSTRSAERVLAFAKEKDLQIEWILETHAHADHLSAAAFLKRQLDVPVGIGKGITQVQDRFRKLYGFEQEFRPDGSQFDQLLEDGDVIEVGDLTIRVMATPGHTDDSLTYRVGDAAFVGDTLFAPDVGTARADFPGGDAAKLYRSIRSLLALPDETRLFLCHDYPPAAREQEVACVTVEDQRDHNIHVGGDVDESAFVKMREARDATLAVPKLILPSLQVNIRAGELPPPDDNGIRYLRMPINQLGAE